MTKKWHIYNHSLIWFWDNCKIYVIEFWLYPWRTCIKSFEIWASYSERVHKLMCLKWTTRIFRIERFKAFSVGGFFGSPSIKIYTFYFKISNVTFYDLITKHKLHNQEFIKHDKKWTFWWFWNLFNAFFWMKLFFS